VHRYTILHHCQEISLTDQRSADFNCSVLNFPKSLIHSCDLMPAFPSFAKITSQILGNNSKTHEWDFTFPLQLHIKMQCCVIWKRGGNVLQQSAASIFTVLILSCRLRLHAAIEHRYVHTPLHTCTWCHSTVDKTHKCNFNKTYYKLKVSGFESHQYVEFLFH
jgi:hypothetical protein